MKVQIIRPTISRKKLVLPGEVLEVSKDEAVQLIGAGKAVAFKESAVETTLISQDVVEQAVSVNTETVETTKRGPKKRGTS
jgi:hypothetical protein